MRSSLLRAGAALIIAAGCARAATPPPVINPTGGDAAPPPAAPAQGSAAAPAGEMTLDQVLDALHARGENLEAFDAKVELTEKDLQTITDSTRAGRIWYQKTEAGGGRLRLMLDKKLEKDKLTDAKQEYLLDKGWLTDRDYVKRIEVRRQVLRPGERMNLLKLGEGPFPLPIGQPKEEVKRQFNVRLVPTAKEEPAGTIHVILVTDKAKNASFARKFKQIDIWVDPKTSMPVRIDTIDPKESSSKSTLLRDVRINPKLTDADFKLEDIDEARWKSHEEPFAEK